MNYLLLSQLAAGLLGVYILNLLYLRVLRYGSHQQFIKKHGCEPTKILPSRYPFGIDTFIENINDIKSHTLLSSYQQLFYKLGSTTFFAQFLWLTTFSTTEPENIKAILATDFKSYSVGEERNKSLRPILGEGIFTTDGSAWQHSRDLLRPCFTRSQLGDVRLFEKHVRNLMRAIPRDGSTVDLQGLFFKLTMDIAAEFLLGESTYTLDPDKRRPEDDRFVEAFNYAQNSVEGKSFLDWVDELVGRSLAKHPQSETATLKTSEDDGSKERYLLLAELASQTSDKIRIRTELLNVLLAGRDTTASLLSNVWWSISKDPTIWNRLQEEVTSLKTPLGKERPIFEELKDMKYLRAVLNESLRVHPVVPANSRQAIQDTMLPVGGGVDGKSPVFIPKGAIVNYGVHAMHHRKDLFGEDADQFRPQRWLDEEGKKGLRVGWEYLPFNGGPRICIGRECFKFENEGQTTNQEARAICPHGGRLHHG
ncbi:MAG: hypothetical protein Q9219_003980 [cf. Caloplaca sp. 3 TL-2023]